MAFGIVACASTPMPVGQARRRQELRWSAPSRRRPRSSRRSNSPRARNKYAAAQAAVDKHDAEVAARLADQADVDAQLAESTARAKQQEQLVTEMDAGAARPAQRNAAQQQRHTAPVPQPPQPARRRRNEEPTMKRTICLAVAVARPRC